MHGPPTMRLFQDKGMACFPSKILQNLILKPFKYVDKIDEIVILLKLSTRDLK